MSYCTAEFVGGPKDGERLRILEGSPTFTFPAPPAPITAFDPHHISEKVAYRGHVYVRRAGLPAGPESVSFYDYRGLE